MKKNLPSLALIVVMFSVGMYIVPYRLMHSDLSFMPGDLGDARFTNYIFEHGYKWISCQVESFWDAPFFYPTVRTLALSENFLGTLPIYSLFRVLGFDRETSLQLWYFAVFAINYFACAWVLRKLSINALGAAAGSYVFTFSLPVLAQLGHASLLPRFMIPFAFYYALRYLEKPSIKTFALTFIAVVIQFYCALYVAMFLVLGLLTLLIAFILFNSDRSSALRNIFWGSYRFNVSRLLVIILTGLMLLPLMRPYYTASLEYGVRSWDVISVLLPRFKSYLFPVSGSIIWDWLLPLGSTLPARHEHHIYFGLLPLSALIAMPFIYYRFRNETLTRTGIIAFVTILLMIILTLNFRGLSLYRYVLLLPGLNGLRAITRIVFVILFPLSLVLGVILTKLSENKKTLANITFTSFVLVAIVLDQYVISSSYPVYSKLDSQNRSKVVEQIFKNEASPSGIIAYMPDKIPPAAHSATLSPATPTCSAVHLDAMMAAQNLNVATINGCSSVYPPSYREGFYDKYDQCDSLEKWKAVAAHRYGKYYRNKELFKDLIIIGRDACLDNNKRYTVMDGALPRNGYNASITFSSSQRLEKRGEAFNVGVLVKNISSSKWSSLSDSGSKYMINLSCRWLSSDHVPMNGSDGFDKRYSLPFDVPPGTTVSYSINLTAPDKPGTYYLEFDMVQEQVTWFRDQGSPTSFLKVVII